MSWQVAAFRVRHAHRSKLGDPAFVHIWIKRRILLNRYDNVWLRFPPGPYIPPTEPHSASSAVPQKRHETLNEDDFTIRPHAFWHRNDRKLSCTTALNQNASERNVWHNSLLPRDRRDHIWSGFIFCCQLLLYCVTSLFDASHLSSSLARRESYKDHRIAIVFIAPENSAEIEVRY